MATKDLHHDIEPKHKLQKPVFPTLEQLRQALTDAGKDGSYELGSMTRNDLIFACRQEGVDLFPLPEDGEEPE